MHQCTILIASVGILAAFLTSSSVTASVDTTNLCPPDASPKMRQLCLLASLEQFLAENPPRPNADVLDTQLYDRGTKRQDVDHVFLRFGRRLGL
ncbi:hypothetical protein ILUMI_20454 [Ignelater luminosus]|uniref:Myosuppressin n=1 Tax=Ignelater luminosus TaxID=2038154 RepID=A0A8K0CHC4_IGNLU|nr:hypothetical protein ILUMI_20454 [Ignelater luminosus]